MRIRTIATTIAATAAAASTLVVASPAEAAAIPKNCVAITGAYGCFWPKGDKFCLTDNTKGSTYARLEWTTGHKGGRGSFSNKKGYNTTVCKSFSKQVAERSDIWFRVWTHARGSGSPLNLSDLKKRRTS